MSKIGFGHKFTIPSGLNYNVFKRTITYHAEIFIPNTYGKDKDKIEVRAETSENRFSDLYPVTIGQSAIEGLKDLEIAEIVISNGVTLEQAQSALSLYGEHFDTLLKAKPPQEDNLSGISGRLNTDDREDPSLAASEFSSRFAGERGLLLQMDKRIENIERYDYIQKEIHNINPENALDRLQLKDPSVQNLFQALGLKLPDKTDPHSRVIRLNLLRLFKDGAAYTARMDIPIEFIDAKIAVMKI